MNDAAQLDESTLRRRGWLPVVATAAIVTIAGVVWLTVAGNLAATGTRIAELEHQRETLAERRAHALIAHAQATDPRRLEARAAELGFHAPEAVSFVPVTLPIGHPAPSRAVNSESPLGVLLARDGKSVPTVTSNLNEPGGVLVSTPAQLEPGGATSLAMAAGSAAP